MRPHNRRRRRRLLLLAGCLAVLTVVLVSRRRASAGPTSPPARPQLPAPGTWETAAEQEPPEEDPPEVDPEEPPVPEPEAATPPSRRDRRVALAVHLVDGFTIFLVTTTMWLALYAFGPRLLGWQPRSVISGSMQPNIRPGDVVVVKAGDAALGPGVLVTFNDKAQPGRVLTHRVFQLNDDGTWTTKGDANREPDSTPVSPDDIIGQPRLVVPLIGLPAYWRVRGGVPPSALVVGGLVVLLFVARAVVRRIPLSGGPEQVASGHIPAQRSDASADGTPAEEESWESASASS